MKNIVIVKSLPEIVARMAEHERVNPRAHSVTNNSGTVGKMESFRDAMAIFAGHKAGKGRRPDAIERTVAASLASKITSKDKAAKIGNQYQRFNTPAGRFINRDAFLRGDERNAFFKFIPAQKRRISIVYAAGALADADAAQMAELGRLVIALIEELKAAYNVSILIMFPVEFNRRHYNRVFKPDQNKILSEQILSSFIGGAEALRRWAFSELEREVGTTTACEYGYGRSMTAEAAYNSAPAEMEALAGPRKNAVLISARALEHYRPIDIITSAVNAYGRQ